MKNWMQMMVAVCVMTGLGNVAAHAQAAAVSGLAKTDVALSFYGSFSGTTTGDNVKQSPANGAGGMVEVRHIANSLLGFEGTYSFNRADQSYTPTAVPCGISCGDISTTTVKADAHEVSADYLASVKILNLRPFGLAGAGLLFNQPTSGQNMTSSSTKGAFIYGAGLDLGLLPHIGLRLQYRGNLYKTPDLTKLYGSSNVFLHTSEPMIGVYFRL
jgi:opacity protein-like surface antigen